jgi:hypothetical protein
VQDRFETFQAHSVVALKIVVVYWASPHVIFSTTETTPGLRPYFRYYGPRTKNSKRRWSMAYLEGQLRGKVAGESEGEHTGYVLEVEVDMSAVQNAQEIVGEQVAVTGEVVIVDYPERGKVLIFRATSAAAIEEEETDEVE